ncbi:MAG: type II toxin-antitoxin system HicA family toxin [Dehalococcoidia bacterium]|nr:type II toxin-antitoxin system HicA family toxin [Dehalococcoidia bacterium]
MSVEHLDILYAELPDLFQIRDLSPVWDDDLLIIKIEDPEWNGGESNDELAKGRIDQLSSSDLENWGADLRDTLWMAPNAVSVPAFSDVVIDVLVGAHAGAPIPYTDRSKMPPSDCLAFYLPFHYYHPTWWGVYLLFEGVLWLANEIVRRSGGSVNRIGAIRGSRLFLYYHEAFHHKTECFATRLALTHRKPFFKDGFERLYKNTIGTADCLEEGLSNAVALLDSHRRMKDRRVDQALTGYVLNSPPGYDQGARIRRQEKSVRCQFAERNQQICLPHLPCKTPEVWRTAPHMFDGISNIKGRVNYVIPRSSPLAARLPFRPMLPPSKLLKKLKEVANLEFVRHGGSHDIYRMSSNGRPISIPRHPRDLGPGLIRSILREAGLDMGLEEFRQL